MARSPLRTFFDGLVGGILIGVLLTYLVGVLYLQEFVGTPLVSADVIIFVILVLIGVIVGLAYDAHKAAAP